VHEYFFSISDKKETITSMETASLNMVLVCVHSTSVTNSQNLLPLSAQSSLNTLSAILPSDNSREEITYSRVLRNSPVPKILSKYSIKKTRNPSFVNEEVNNIEENGNKKRRNTVK